MENKIGARFICLDEPAFYELLEALYSRLKVNEKGPKWVDTATVMKRLNISSPTTLQKIRDSGELRISMISKKLILYDSDSVNEYLEKRSRK